MVSWPDFQYCNMDPVLEVETSGQRRDVVGVVIHVMAVTALGGAAMAVPVVGDDAIAWLRKNIIRASHSSADSGQPWLRV